MEIYGKLILFEDNELKKLMELDNKEIFFRIAIPNENALSKYAKLKIKELKKKIRWEVI